MTYKETYYKIIQHRQAHPLEDGVYGEKHHIYPKSLFPQFVRAKWNIVKLTPQEHYQCHYLLTKWFEESGERLAYEKMVTAWNAMTHTRSGLVVNAEQYAELKEKYRDVMRNSDWAKENIKKAYEAAHRSEKAKEAARQNVKKAQEASRHSEKYKEVHRQLIKKAQEASRHSEKHKEAARNNLKKALESSLKARIRPFEIDGIRFEHILDAAKYFKVGVGSIHRWLHNPDTYKKHHICKYI